MIMMWFNTEHQKCIIIITNTPKKKVTKSCFYGWKINPQSHVKQWDRVCVINTYFNVWLMQIQGKISRGDDKRGRVLLMFLLHVDKNNAKKGTKRGVLNRFNQVESIMLI